MSGWEATAFNLTYRNTSHVHKRGRGRYPQEELPRWIQSGLERLWRRTIRTIAALGADGLIITGIVVEVKFNSLRAVKVLLLDLRGQ